LNNF
jgi:hypothetical protein